MRGRRRSPGSGGARAFHRAVFVLLLSTLVGCSADTPSASEASEPEGTRARSSPWIVVGIDGAEWSVLHRLWDDGRLPVLRGLAERGSSGVLETAYASSPVIWTTIATGRRPEVHGIENFIVSTPRGDVPVSSAVRRVPALWNMATRTGRSVAVYGWWASWPAEEVDGVVVSDRVLSTDLPGRVFPAASTEGVDAEIREILAEPHDFRGNAAAGDRDRALAELARRHFDPSRDLTLVYFRSVDIESHHSWKDWEPEPFGIDPSAVAPEDAERIPAAYAAVDAAIGRLLERSGDGVNVLVVSDHGFHAQPPEEIQVLVEMNRVLERLGWLHRTADGDIDLSRSRVFSYGTQKNRRPKRMRFSLKGRDEPGAVEPGDREAVRAELAADLARLEWEDGSPAFVVRDATDRTRRSGADFEVFVTGEPRSATLLHDGARIEGLVEQVTRISGSHGTSTHGIWIAAGPDVAPGADIERFSIFDVAPTLLSGLGIPVAEDFAGEAREALFRERFFEDHPPRTVPTWGTREASEAETSAVDGEILDELRALGYL